VMGGGKPVGSLETVFDLRRGSTKRGKRPASATRSRA